MTEARKIKILPDSMVMTCNACPSQWDAKTSDGQNAYVRFRGDLFSVYYGGEDGLDNLIFNQPGVTGEPYAGCMETSEALEIMGENSLLDYQPPPTGAPRNE